MVYWIGIGLDSSSSMFIHYQLENLMRLYWRRKNLSITRSKYYDYHPKINQKKDHPFKQPAPQNLNFPLCRQGELNVS